PCCRGRSRGQIPGPPAAALRNVVDGLVALGLEHLGQLGDIGCEYGPFLGPLERQCALDRGGDLDAAKREGGHRGNGDEQQQTRAPSQVLEGATGLRLTGRAWPRVLPLGSGSVAGARADAGACPSGAPLPPGRVVRFALAQDRTASPRFTRTAVPARR